MLGHPDWPAPAKPAELAYNRLIEAILDASFPANTTLPGERQLSEMLGVTRPTLRETLQRLDADGWVDIQHGKPTRVRDIWVEGSLNTLAALVDHHAIMPAAFVPQLLEVRLALAPAYTQAAVERNSEAVTNLLSNLQADLADTPESFAGADWKLHHRLTVLSTNPIYTLILNGFEGFYEQMARLYFRPSHARDVSRQFYTDLQAAARRADAGEARRIAERVMRESIGLWEEAAELLDQADRR